MDNQYVVLEEWTKYNENGQVEYKKTIRKEINKGISDDEYNKLMEPPQLK